MLTDSAWAGPGRAIRAPELNSPTLTQGRDHGEGLSSLEAQPVAGTQLPALDWVITCRPTQTGKSLACIGNLGSSTVL